MRKVPAFICLVVATMLLPLTSVPPTMAATVGNSHPQSGRIVSDDPANFTPHILDGTVYSIVQVGDMVVVGGDFTQVRSATSSTIITRNRVFAFNATTGAISTSFKPNPNNTVYKVQAAADGKSVYVGGRFGSAYGVSMPSRLFKANVATGARDLTFRPGTFSGDIRDLEVIGNRLWVAGKFTHIAGVAQKALGTISALDGKKDSYFTGVIAGTHRNHRQPPGGSHQRPADLEQPDQHPAGRGGQLHQRQRGDPIPDRAVRHRRYVVLAGALVHHPVHVQVLGATSRRS